MRYTEAGVDIIELGMPFTDPAADGPTIEEAGLRSLKAGTTLKAILDMAKAFRQTNMWRVLKALFIMSL